MTRGDARARGALQALAERAGILPEYVDQTGVVRHTADSTRVALLAAMGLPAATASEVRATLGELAAQDARRVLAPARVVPPSSARTVPLHLPSRRSGRLRWTLEVSDENGRTRRAEGEMREADAGRGIRLPFALAPGYYRLTLRIGAAGEEDAAEQALVVTPGRCVTPEDLGVGRAYGLLANLYTLRSSQNWGAGDLSDLGRLVDFTGAVGGAFVGINPLHALANVDDEISPYSPLSRLYRNPLYLDVGAVPELGESTAVRRRLDGPTVRAATARLRATAHVDYAGVMRAKDAILRELHRVFAARHRGRETARGRAYERYRAAEGRCLLDYATFVALRAHFAARGRARRDWHRWPAAYRDCRSGAVELFCKEHDDEIDYHCWVQFELDRQLGAVAARARASGLTLGVYQDLALGSSPGGADPWAFPGLFLENGVAIGAPPDPLGPEGQNWGLPPIDPLALARDGCRYWIRLLRAAFRHVGALRIDHVMGLFRQFWIPPGRPGSEGAYVRMPARDLLGILALESQRARAVVIGEDLGTVPAGLPHELARWGILSMRVLPFQRDARGAYLPSGRYTPRALVSANTHDMAPLAGFWQGRDLALRRQVGWIRAGRAFAAAQRERESARQALRRRLSSEGALRDGDTPAALCTAVHSFLARTPSRLLGVSLDDLAGEVDPVNLPGVGLDVFPSWSRKMTRSLDDLLTDAAVRRALGEAPARRGATGRRSRSRRRARNHAR